MQGPPPAAAGPPPAPPRPVAEAAPAAPRVDLADPTSVWKAVLDTAGQSNAAAWMDHFRLAAIDTSASPAVAVLAPTMSFAGGAANVATGPRLQRVADTITQLAGRPVRAELAAATPAPDAGSPPDAAAPTHRGGVDRREALNLPLVRDVFDVFPDASLIDARKDTPPD